MTKNEAKNLGTEHGKTRGESVCLDTPWQGIAERLQKWRKRKTWSDSVDEDEWLRPKVPESHWQVFRNAYIAAGMKHAYPVHAHDHNG